MVVKISHPDLGVKTFHYADTFTRSHAVRQCRAWAAENGYYGARIA